MEDENKADVENKNSVCIAKNKNNKGITLVSVCLVVSCVLNFHLICAWLKSVNFSRDGLPIKNVQKLNMVKTIMTDYYYKDIDRKELVESCIEGMTKLMDDPYSVYLRENEMELLKQNTEGSYKGIGITLKLGDDNLITISEVFDDSPAKKAGIIKGDKILRVNGENFTNLTDSKVIVDFIKEKDEDINMEILRPSTNEEMSFVLRADKIKLISVKSKIMDDDIGYIKIRMFDDGVSKSFKEHLDDLKSKNIKGLLIDLRDNPGGEYREVIDIANLLLEEGNLIVYTEDKNKKQVKEYAKGKGIDLPIGVLVNKYSASASEVLSGALKDNNKAWLLGDKTYGKGLVQTVISFKDGTGLKLTTSRYFIPSGKCIDGEGIEPDYKIDLPDDYEDYSVTEIPEQGDTQLKNALDIIKKEV